MKFNREQINGSNINSGQFNNRSSHSPNYIPYRVESNRYHQPKRSFERMARSQREMQRDYDFISNGSKRDFGYSNRINGMNDKSFRLLSSKIMTPYDNMVETTPEGGLSTIKNSKYDVKGLLKENKKLKKDLHKLRKLNAGWFSKEEKTEEVRIQNLYVQENGALKQKIKEIEVLNMNLITDNQNLLNERESMIKSLEQSKIKFKNNEDMRKMYQSKIQEIKKMNEKEMMKYKLELEENMLDTFKTRELDLKRQIKELKSSLSEKEFERSIMNKELKRKQSDVLELHRSTVHQQLDLQHKDRDLEQIQQNMQSQFLTKQKEISELTN